MEAYIRLQGLTDLEILRSGPRWMRIALLRIEIKLVCDDLANLCAVAFEALGANRMN